MLKMLKMTLGLIVLVSLAIPRSALAQEKVSAAQLKKQLGATNYYTLPCVGNSNVPCIQQPCRFETPENEDEPAPNNLLDNPPVTSYNVCGGTVVRTRFAAARCTRGPGKVFLGTSVESQAQGRTAPNCTGTVLGTINICPVDNCTTGTYTVP